MAGQLIIGPSSCGCKILYFHLWMSIGMDVARKVVILARECGMHIELDDVEVESLVPDPLQSTSSVLDFMERLPEARNLPSKVHHSLLVKAHKASPFTSDKHAHALAHLDSIACIVYATSLISAAYVCCSLMRRWRLALLKQQKPAESWCMWALWMRLPAPALSPCRSTLYYHPFQCWIKL